MGNKGVMIGIAALVLLGLGGYFLMSQKSSQVNSTPNMEVPVPAGETSELVVEESESMTETEGEAREIVVEGDEYSFSPSSLTITSGEKVRIVLNNIGKMPHDFVIDELNVQSETINGGQSTSVEFTAGEPGTYTYYCSIGNHRVMGMEGTLTVE